MQRLRKFISTALSVTTLLTLVGGGASAAMAAGRLTEAKVTMTVVRATQVSSHTISFKLASNTDIKTVVFNYRKEASGSVSKPQALGLTAPSKGTVTFGGGADESADWTMTQNDEAGDVTFTHTTGNKTPVNSGDVATFTIGNITNNNTTGADVCDSITDSDTCYIRITTYSDAGVTEIDKSVTTYTVINPIVVEAVVDPSLTFTVAGVNSAAITGNDANVTAGSGVTTTPVSINFGNIRVGSANTKIAQQQLNVMTNANNGYKVYNKFVGTDSTTDLMKGTYTNSGTVNNIDPFVGNTAAWPDDGGTPGTWTTPTGGSRNTDTGWLGIRTKNGGVSNFNANDKYAPPYVGTGVGKIVMSSDTPDNGLTNSYVTLRMEVNAYQPSDTYTGTMVYNVVASY